MFDPSIKKKKKKKKFDLDSALAAEVGVDGANEQTLDKENQDPVPDFDEFDGMKILNNNSVNSELALNRFRFYWSYISAINFMLHFEKYWL